MLRPLLILLAAGSFAAVAAAQAPPKRALTHADYDIWNGVTGMTLSPDGKFVAYTLGLPRGDATFIVRNVATGAEFKFAKGGTPALTPTPEAKDEAVTPGDEDQIPRAGFGIGAAAVAGISGGPAFAPDSRFLYFVLTPTKAEAEKAGAEKKKPEEMPKPVLAVLELATGTIKEKISGIRSFSITGTGAGVLITVKEPKPEPKAEAKPEPKLEAAPMPKTAEKKKDQEPKPPEPKKTEPKTPPETTPTPRSPTGYDHVIRNLADGKEATFADVQDYTITRDYSQILYTVASKKPETNGVYFAALFEPAKAQALLKGPGRYSRLTWDEKQTRLAFFFDDTPLPAATTPSTAPTAPGVGTPPLGKGRRAGAGAGGIAAATAPAVTKTNPRAYLWDRPTKEKPFAVAVLAVGPETPGLKKGWQIVDRGGLGFTADGLKLTLSAAPEPEKPAEPKPAEPKGPATPAAAPAEKVDLDLWHWKDELIQPMQKLRGNLLRNRSYAVAYLLDEKRLVHLAEEDRSVRVPEYGDWGLAATDKKYRFATWDSPTPSDYTLVNIRTGDVKPLLTGARSGLSSSPKNTYLAGFDGRNWFSLHLPDGKRTNLTGKLPTKFFNEDADMPMIAPPYSQFGWSADDKHFYVGDKHDIWKLAADGSSAVNITQIGANTGLRFRIARIEKPEDENAPDRGLDDKSPWLLAAENLTTHDTGFYRLLPGQTPKLLLMGARSYGVPTKAKKGETMILTVSTFTDYPDYYTTTPDFKEIKRLTDANPQRSRFHWATAELVHYTNTDGAHLQGILVKPDNFDAAKKYPMIVYIYERFSDTFHNYHSPVVSRGQVINPIWYASNGYLVLIPDIAYKVGLPGQSALQCVLPAIQAVADKGFLNEKAIGINGQSWGGYQIAYMVTQTNRFKAAVAGAAVTDMVSAYNGIRWGSGLPRQFQYEHTQSRIGETLWQAPMKYIENSPVFMADRVKTPLMMINNDADDAVPWYQGIEFYLSLRRLGREAYMFNYNGEPHNLLKTVNARDFALRMQQFYDHHLKGAPMPEWMAKGVPFAERDREKEQWKKLFAPEKK